MSFHNGVAEPAYTSGGVGSGSFLPRTFSVVVDGVTYQQTEAGTFRVQNGQYVKLNDAEVFQLERRLQALNYAPLNSPQGTVPKLTGSSSIVLLAGGLLLNFMLSRR